LRFRPAIGVATLAAAEAAVTAAERTAAFKIVAATVAGKGRCAVVDGNKRAAFRLIKASEIDWDIGSTSSQKRSSQYLDAVRKWASFLDGKNEGAAGTYSSRDKEQKLSLGKAGCCTGDSNKDAWMDADRSDQIRASVDGYIRTIPTDVVVTVAGGVESSVTSNRFRNSSLSVGESFTRSFKNNYVCTYSTTTIGMVHILQIATLAVTSALVYDY
jgi:hypothetical protein